MSADDHPRLRRTFAAVADGPVDDAWDAIRERVEHDAIVEPPTPGPRRTWLVAAAVLAVVAIGTAAWVVSRPEGGRHVRTAEDAPAEPAPTGWYVPEGLEGWTVTSVAGSLGRDPVCAAEAAVWSRPNHVGSVRLDHSCTPPETEEEDEEATGDAGGFPTFQEVDVDLGHGVTGRGLRPAGELAGSSNFGAFLHWDRPGPYAPGGTGGRWSLRAQGLTTEQVEAAARALVAAPPFSAPPVAGMELVDRWSHPDLAGTAEVQVTMADPEGRSYGYQLDLPGTQGIEPQPVPRPIPEQPLPIHGIAQLDGTWSAGRANGRWPGADLRAYLWTTETEGSAAQRPTDAGVDELVGSLRPATTAQWQAFVSTAERTVGPVAEVATLADLADPAAWADHPDPLDVPPGEVEDPDAPTDTASATSTTVGPPTTTSTTPTPPGGATFTVTPEPTVVALGSTLVLHLRLENPTDHVVGDAGCLGAFDLSFVPIGDDGAVRAGEPTRTGRLGRCETGTLAAGQAEVEDLPWATTDPGMFGTPLRVGRYRIEARVHGGPTAPPVEIEVRPAA